MDDQMALSRRLIFRQLFDRISYTYTYLLGDKRSGQAVLIDPVLETAERDVTLANELGLKLRYLINTHVHADHVTGTGRIKKLLARSSPSPISVIAKSSEAVVDLHVNEGDVIECGQDLKLQVLATPGHTPGCISLVDHDDGFVFTGDALLIRGCGRTDFQNGSSSQLYDSVMEKLFTLPDHYLVFPAHDYKGVDTSSIGEEKRFNPRLTKSKEEFIEIMANLNLDKPNLIDEAVPRNMKCGV